MADTTIPAVNTAPASTTVVATPAIPTLAPDATTEQPIQNPVTANEQARLAAQSLSEINYDRGVIWSPTSCGRIGQGRSIPWGDYNMLLDKP